MKNGIDRAGDGVGGWLNGVCIGGFDGIKDPKPSSCGVPGSREKDDIVESDGDAVICEYCFTAVITELTNGEE
jgi:hypothetical protein